MGEGIESRAAAHGVVLPDGVLRADGRQEVARDQLGALVDQLIEGVLPVGCGDARGDRTNAGRSEKSVAGGSYQLIEGVCWALAARHTAQNKEKPRVSQERERERARRETRVFDCQRGRTARLAPNDRSRRDLHRLAVARDALAVGLHVALLQVPATRKRTGHLRGWLTGRSSRARWVATSIALRQVRGEAVQVLVVGQHCMRLRPEEVAVPHAKRGEEHCDGYAEGSDRRSVRERAAGTESEQWGHRERAVGSESGQRGQRASSGVRERAVGAWRAQRGQRGQRASTARSERASSGVRERAARSERATQETRVRARSGRTRQVLAERRSHEVVVHLVRAGQELDPVVPAD